LTHYLVSTLRDGTVLAAVPIRKPHPKEMKRRGHRVGKDGETNVSVRSGFELSNWNDEGRLRFLDIIATNLNTRRAIRELVVPKLDAMLGEIKALNERMDGIRVDLRDGGGLLRRTPREAARG
jgi:hypothetical protein